MDRVLLERVSSLLVIAGFILGVGSLVVATRVFGGFPTRETPGSLIYMYAALVGGVIAYAGVIMDQYLKTGSLRRAFLNWAAGFAFVLAVALGGYLLRR